MRVARSSGDGVCFFTVAFVSYWIHLTFHPWPFDDALIHFRIAEHLVQTGEPYFNAGEAVMGSSSPAWTLLLAAVFLVFPATTGVVALLEASIVAVGCRAWCTWIQGETEAATPWWTGWGFAPVYLSVVHFSGAGLMETPLAVALVGFALQALRTKRATGVALLAVASFVRLEVALLWISLATWAALTRRVSPSRIAAASLLGALPFVAYWLTYFPLFPHTITAKSRVYDVPWGETLEALTRQGSPAVRWLSSQGPRLVLLAILAVLLIAGVILRSRGAGRAAGTGAWGVLMVSGLIAGGTYVISGSLLFPWYVPIVALPITAVVYLVGASSGSSALRTLTFLALVVPHAIALENTLSASLGPIERYPYLAENARVRRYLDVARRLDAHSMQARLMSSEVGALGFGFRGRVVDGMGLVSPEALRHHPLHVPDERSRGSLGAIPPALVEEVRPEVVVSLDIFSQSLRRASVAEGYVDLQLPVYLPVDAARLQTARLWESDHLHVWLRKDLVVLRSDVSRPATNVR